MSTGDPLEISPSDLEQLQQSENIEFIVEEGDGSENEEPIYIYVEDEDEATKEKSQGGLDYNENDGDGDGDSDTNDDNSNENKKKDSDSDYNIDDFVYNSDDDESNIYTLSSDDEDEPRKSRSVPKSKKQPERNRRNQDKESIIPEPKSVQLSKATSENQSTPKNRFILPKITNVRGAIDVPPPLHIPVTPIQQPPITSSGHGFFLNSPPPGAVGQTQLLPNQAVNQIVKALGLSVQDIERHGGTVAISIPEKFVKNGVLDLTQLPGVKEAIAIGPAAQPFAPSMPSTAVYQNNSKNVPSRKPTTSSISGKCYIEKCNSAFSNENIVFFDTPFDEPRRRIWDFCIGIGGKQMKFTDKICIKHFDKSDIIYVEERPQKGSKVAKVELVNGAVPCINYREMCCVPGCTSRYPEKRMFPIPVHNSSNRDLWLYMIRNPTLKTLNVKELLRHRVCINHFDSTSFSSPNNLRRTAAPTKHLPEANFTHLHSESSRALPDFSKVKLQCAERKCNRTNNVVFPFPPDFDRCQMWLYNCDRLDLLCTTQEATMLRLYGEKLGLCQDHFDHHHFENRRKTALRPGAIPVVSVNSSNTAPVANTKASERKKTNLVESSRERTRNILPFVCFYLGCDRTMNDKEDEDDFFAFPKEPRRRKEWLEACGYMNFGEVNVNYKICKKHFLPKMFDKNGNLRPSAVPIPSTQKVDGPNQDPEGHDGINHSGSSPSSGPPQQNSAFVANLNAVVNKWIDKSPLEFLRCALPNCDKVFTTVSYRGRAQMFPDPTTDPLWYNSWLRIIGSPILKAMTPAILMRTYVICNKHFAPECLLEEGAKLVPLSNPTNPYGTNTPRTNTSVIKQRPTPLKSKSTSNDGLLWKMLDSVDLADSKDKTMCLLEEDNIVFPGMGYYLVDYNLDVKTGRKRPFGVYQYNNQKQYTKANEIEFGESLNIHTAIIIDDDDEMEAEVLKQISEKRLKV